MSRTFEKKRVAVELGSLGGLKAREAGARLSNRSELKRSPARTVQGDLENAPAISTVHAILRPSKGTTAFERYVAENNARSDRPALGNVFLPDPNGDYGDRFISLFSAHWRQAIESRIKQLCPDPSKINIEFGFLASGELNAFADIYDKTDIIGMNVGVFSILSELFDRLLANPNVLQHIGDPKQETEIGRYAAERTEVPPGYICGRIQPKNAERRKYSQMLLELGIDFIFNHELGHIFHGHTSWLQQSRGLAAISERRRGPGIGFVDWLTLEMDADVSATIDAMGTVFGLHKDTDTGALVIPEKTILGSRREALFAWAFSTYCFFRIIAGEERSFQRHELLSLTHPPARYRQIIIAATLWEYFNRHNFMTQSECLRIFTLAALEAESGFSMLIGKPLSPVIHSDVRQDCGWLVKQLNDNWKIIRPQLDALKRGGNLAP